MSKMEKLEKMEEVGFRVFGKIFKETLAYIQIQREKRELLNEAA